MISIRLVFTMLLTLLAAPVVFDHTAPTASGWSIYSTGLYAYATVSEPVTYTNMGSSPFSIDGETSNVASIATPTSTTLRVNFNSAIPVGTSPVIAYLVDGSIVDAYSNELSMGSATLTNYTLGVTGSAGTPSGATVATSRTIAGGIGSKTTAWTTPTKPSGATSTPDDATSGTPTFTVSKAGSYIFRATVTDSVGTSKSVDVSASFTAALATINVTPDGDSISTIQTKQFASSRLDQFGDASAGTVTWSVFSGPGSINSSGLYTPSGVGTATIRATSGSVFGAATVSVTTNDFPVFPAPDDVRAGATYGPTGTEYEGTLNTSPAADPSVVLEGEDCGDGTLGVYTPVAADDTRAGVLFGANLSEVGTATFGSGLTLEEILDGITTDHGSGSYVGSGGGGGTGDGDIEVNQDTGGVDNYRFVIDGIPQDNCVIRAYVQDDYDAGTIDPIPPSTKTGSDGRWVSPLNLDADTYLLNVYNPTTKRVTTIRDVVVS